VEEIGLFPLGIVLLPGERAPLHIFEERYKELIGECIELDGDFGLALEDDDGMRTVGTLASVVEVLERLPDGRMNIVVSGGDRFRIVGLTAGRAFTTAQVERFQDASEGAGGAEGGEPSPEDAARCLARYRELVDLADAEPEELDLTAESLAFEVAGRIAFDPDSKQELLEMRSEGGRVRRLDELLETAIEGVRLRHTIRERAAGNGHVPGS